MGKGDKKSKKGKRSKGSYGKSRKSVRVNRKRKNEIKKREKVLQAQFEKLRFLCTGHSVQEMLSNETSRRLKENPTDENLKEYLLNVENARKAIIQKINDIRFIHFPFSIEELFVNNGQYDRFVSIEFFPDSNAFQTYGESIMGTFIFSQYERKFFKRYIRQKHYPRTHQMVRFNPSRLCELNEDQINQLEETGFDSRDIKTIYQTDMPYENRYEKSIEYKEIPNTIDLEIKDDGSDYGPLLLHLYEERISSDSYPLITEEYDQYLAFRYLYKQDDLSEEEKKKIFDDDQKILRPHIADQYIKQKFYLVDKLTPEDEILFDAYMIRLVDNAKKAVDREVSKSSADSLLAIITRDFVEYQRGLYLATYFEPQNLSNYGAKHSVRLGLPGFLHVFLRHSREFQLGDWKGTRTPFEYEIKDVIRIIKLIIEDLQVEIDAALEQGKDFQLAKGSAYRYDGNYYAIHISKNGDLLSFSPRNK